MKTIEITDEIIELLELYGKDYSKTIKQWKDEVFSTRMSTISEKNTKFKPLHERVMDETYFGEHNNNFIRSNKHE